MYSDIGSYSKGFNSNEAMMSRILPSIARGVDTVDNTVSQVRPMISRAAGATENAMKEAVKALQVAEGSISNIASNAGNAISNIAQTTGTAISNVSRTTGTAISDVAKSTGIAISRAGDATNEAIGKVGEVLQDTISSTGEAAKSTFKLIKVLAIVVAVFIMIMVVALIIVLILCIIALWKYLFSSNCNGSKRIATRTKLLKSGKGQSVKQVNDQLKKTKKLCDARMISFSCMDDCSSPNSYKTPGGDMGEFILAHQVYRNKLGERPPNTSEHFNNYVDNIDSEVGFYMHTNRECISYIEDTLSMNVPEDFSEFPEDRQEDYLRLFEIDPHAYGCSHLKNMFLDPESYGVTRDTIAYSCQAYFKCLWSGNKKVNFSVTECDSFKDEGSLVTALYDNVSQNHLVPQIECDSSIRIYNSGALQVGVRRKLSAFFSDTLGRDKNDPKQFLNECNKLGNKQYLKTMDVLAPTLPRMSCSFVVE